MWERPAPSSSLQLPQNNFRELAAAIGWDFTCVYICWPMQPTHCQKESVTGLLWSMGNFSHRPCQSSAYLKTPTSPGAEEGYQPLMQPTTPTVAINNSSSSHSLLAYTLLPSHFASSSSSMECLQGWNSARSEHFPLCSSRRLQPHNHHDTPRDASQVPK